MQELCAAPCCGRGPARPRGVSRTYPTPQGPPPHPRRRAAPTANPRALSSVLPPEASHCDAWQVVSTC